MGHPVTVRHAHCILFLAAIAPLSCGRKPNAPAKEPAIAASPDTVLSEPGAISQPTSFTRLADSGGHRRFHVVNRRFLLTRLYQRYRGESDPHCSGDR